MQGPPSQGFKLLEAVQDVAGLVFRLGGHVEQLSDVSVLNAEREDLDAALPEAACLLAGVSAVREAVGDEEDSLVGRRATILKNFLQYILTIPS